MPVDLAKYDSRGYSPGAGVVKRAVWYLVNFVVIRSWFFPFTGLKCALLRLFGAKVGQGVVIKPRVNIKYPWFLSLGDNAWIGEGVWIDNLANVSLGANACVSQEAYLLTGNHDYSDPFFGLIVSEIVIEDGAWIGARAVVCPGVRVAEYSVIAVGSVISRDTMPYGIYRGIPAEKVRERVIRDV